MQTKHCLFCIIFILHSQKLDAISNKCIKIPLINFRQVAGILSVDIIDDPDFVKFQKPICISNTPSITVTINNVSLNLLNETLSDEGCRDLYEKLLCPQTKKILPNRCREAHHVIFAIMQSLPECKIDKDCENPYKLGDLECNWITDLQHSVCEDMMVLSILAGLSWAFITIFFIYFCQSWCDKVQYVENEAGSAYQNLHFSNG